MGPAVYPRWGASHKRVWGRGGDLEHPLLTKVRIEAKGRKSIPLDSRILMLLGKGELKIDAGLPTSEILFPYFVEKISVF